MSLHRVDQKSPWSPQSTRMTTVTHRDPPFGVSPCDAAVAEVKDVLDSIGPHHQPRVPARVRLGCPPCWSYGVVVPPSAGKFSPSDGENEPFLAFQAMCCDG